MHTTYKQILFFLVSALLFTACSTKEPIITPQNNDISELAESANDDFIDQEKASKDFFSKYFKPWNSTTVTFPKNEAMWVQSYK